MSVWSVRVEAAGTTALEALRVAERIADALAGEAGISSMQLTCAGAVMRLEIQAREQTEPSEG